MAICLCVASRGRHQLLAHTLALTLDNAVRDDTRIVVALDDDDVGIAPQADERVHFSVAPREDTLGAKYNRAFAVRPGADLYIPFVDAVGIVSYGWDQKLQSAVDKFPDGIGAVYFGEKRGLLDLPRMTGLTRKFIEIQGFFIPEFCPWAWWTDTWTNEVSYLAQRVVYADVQLEQTPPSKKTRGAREIKWWGDAYYGLRFERYAIARRIIAASSYDPWQKSTLMQNIEYWGDILNNREAQTTRNPQWAVQYERDHAFDAPADERYNRVKAAMVERLAQEAA